MPAPNIGTDSLPCAAGNGATTFCILAALRHVFDKVVRGAMRKLDLSRLRSNEHVCKRRGSFS